MGRKPCAPWSPKPFSPGEGPPCLHSFHSECYVSDCYVSVSFCVSGGHGGVFSMCISSVYFLNVFTILFLFGWFINSIP